MLSSKFPLFAKNLLGEIALNAQAADPNIVVFPPPFGPIIAVTGKSNVIV